MRKVCIQKGRWTWQSLSRYIGWSGVSEEEGRAERGFKAVRMFNIINPERDSFLSLCWMLSENRVRVGMFFSMCFCLAAVYLDQHGYYGIHFILWFPPPASHRQWRPESQTISVSLLGGGCWWLLMLLTSPWCQLFMEEEGRCQTRVGFEPDRRTLTIALVLCAFHQWNVYSVYFHFVLIGGTKQFHVHHAKLVLRWEQRFGLCKL